VILIISSLHDEHASAVLKEFSNLGAPSTLLDLSQFPQHIHLPMHYQSNSGHSFVLQRTDQDPLSLAECKVIWWRRPQGFQLYPEIRNTPYHAFAYNEGYEAFLGLWQSLNVFWVNHPTRDEVASHKVYQLSTAREVGLTIPMTLITNDPDEAHTFINTLGYEKVVYKTFFATEQHWRETRLLRPDELALLGSVRYAPVIFQEYIHAAVDLRITIVGELIFAAAIHSQETDSKVDYRMHMDHARTEAVELPSEVEKRLLALMSQLGLVYGLLTCD
jgi:glutathione synthase/RimK-type ligase-like ATP-grasp enzyme